MKYLDGVVGQQTHLYQSCRHFSLMQNVGEPRAFQGDVATYQTHLCGSYKQYSGKKKKRL